MSTTSPLTPSDPLDLAPSSAPPSRDAYRQAMSALGAAVHVITTDGPGGRAGFTASAVCSVTDTPPTLLVCLNRSASAHAAVAANGVLCVNTLGDPHEALSARFGGGVPMAERFDGADWSTLASGSPVLDGAVVAFDCRVAQRHAVGTHDVLVCEVVALSDAAAIARLVYCDRRYHRLDGPRPAA